MRSLVLVSAVLVSVASARKKRVLLTDVQTLTLLNGKTSCARHRPTLGLLCTYIVEWYRGTVRKFMRHNRVCARRQNRLLASSAFFTSTSQAK